jgi:hypothetical protein
MGMVFGLALRQTEGLIGSVIGLLRLDLAVPDHSTLSRRAKTLQLLPSPPTAATIRKQVTQAVAEPHPNVAATTARLARRHLPLVKTGLR